MTVVRTRFTLENQEWIAGIDRMNAKLDSFGVKANSVGGALDFTKRLAGIAGMSLALDGLYNSMGRAIDRYNILEGLDKGRLFFNANTQTQALIKGLGDLAIQANATEQAIRFISADANLSPQQYTQMGQAARGFMLAGETKSLEEGIHAIETYITGSQSRTLHRLGVGVATPYAYRQMADQLGISQRDLTGPQMMQARINELFKSPGFTNTADFGKQAGATGLQQFDAMFKNTKDSYIRSVAGAVDELALAVLRLNKATGATDPYIIQNRSEALGQGLATVTPLLLGGMSAGYTFGGRSGAIAGLQQTLAVQQAGLGPAQTAQMLAEQRAQDASLRLIEAQQRYAGMFQRGPGGVPMPHPDLIGPAGGLKRFDQWAPGSAAMTARDSSAVAAQQAAANYQNRLAGVAQQQNAVAASSRAMWGVMGLQIGISAIAAGWIAYTSAIRGAERAVKDFEAATKQGVSGAYQIGQVKSAGGTPAVLAATAEAQGLNGTYLERFKNFAEANPQSPDMQFQFNKLLLEQQNAANLGAQSRGNVATGLRGMAAAFGVGPGGVAMMGLGAAQTFTPTALAKLAQQAQLESANKAFAQALADYEKTEAEKRALGVTDDDSYENFLNLQRRIDDRQRYFDALGPALGGLGIKPDVSVAEQAQRARDALILGADRSKFSGAELQSYDKMFGQAIQNEAFNQQQEKLRAEEKETEQIRKRITDGEKEAQVRMEMAKQQDAMLGTNKGLLDETNEHREKLRRDQQIVEQVTDLRAQGREDLINELGLNQQYQSSLQALTAAQVDFTKQLQQTVLDIRRDASGMLNSAADTVGSVLGAQADISGALAGDNQYLAGGAALLGQFRTAGLASAKYGLNQQLLDAAKTGKMTGNPLIDQALASLPQNPMERGAYLNTLQDQQYKDADSLRTELGSALSGYLNLQTSLQAVPYEKRAMGEAFLNSKTAAEVSRLLPFLMGDLSRMGVLTPDLQAGIAAQMPGTFNNSMTGPGLAGAYADQITSIGMQRSEVAQSNYELKGSVDALKASIDALNMTVQGVPTAPPAGPTAGTAPTGSAKTWGFSTVGPLVGPLPPAFANQQGMIVGPVSALTANGALGIPGQGTAIPSVPMGWEQLAEFAKANGFNVTSTTGGKHNKGSKHYQGLAVDVGVNGKSDAAIQAFMEAAAEAGIKVVDERSRPSGQAVWGGAHLHLEGGNGALSVASALSPDNAQRAYDSALAAMRRHLDTAPPNRDASTAELSGWDEKWAVLVKNAGDAFSALEKAKVGSSTGGGWSNTIDVTQAGFQVNGAASSGPMPVYVVNMPGAAGAVAGGMAGAVRRVRGWGQGTVGAASFLDAGIAPTGVFQNAPGAMPSAANYFGGTAGGADFFFPESEDYGASQYGEVGGYDDGGVWNSDPTGATAVRNKPG